MGLPKDYVSFRPLTASENFQRVVNAIDFNTIDENGVKIVEGKSNQQLSKVSEKMWLGLIDNIK